MRRLATGATASAYDGSQSFGPYRSLTIGAFVPGGTCLVLHSPSRAYIPAVAGDWREVRASTSRSQIVSFANGRTRSVGSDLDVMDDPRMVELVGIAIGLAIVGLCYWIAPKWKLRALQWKWIQRIRGTSRSDLRAILCRDLVAARRLVDTADPNRSAFLRSCIELEAGELEPARTFAARIDIVEPVRPVLLQLIERRAADSSEGWLASLEAAWIGAGRPDLRSSRLLTRDIDCSFDMPQKLDDLSVTDRALCLLMMWRPTYWRRTQAPEALEWARQHGPRLTDVAEVLIAATALPESLPIAERLFDMRPDELWVRLHRWALRRPDGPLDADDLRELATIADARSCDGLLGGVTLARLESAARAAGSRTPLLVATGTAILPLVCGGAALLHRFRGSPRPEQAAAADIYTRLARRMLGDRFLITYAVGFRALELAGTIREADLAPAVARYRPEFELVLDAPDHLANDPARWPILSLVEESIHALFRDERSLHARFRASKRPPS